MSLNAAEIAAVVVELQAVLPGSFLNKLNAPGQNQLQLQFRHHVLLIDLSRGARRLHVIGERLPAPATPPGFVMKARAELTGHRLLSIEQPGGDRVVLLRFGEPERALAIELFGQGRLLLLDAELRVLLPLLGRAEVGTPWTVEARGVPQAESRFGSPAGLQVNAAVERWYAAYTLEATLEAGKRALDRELSAKLRQVERRIEKIELDLARTGEADRLRRMAEALKLALPTVQRGQSVVHLLDYAEPAGGTIEVELDPAHTPVENMQRLFDRARRLARARGAIEERLEAGRREREALREIGARIAMASSLEELAEASARLPRAGESKPRRRPERRSPYRLYVSASGRSILVGRSGTDNHTLTVKVARGSDLWLHARDTQGAHVVVRLDRGEEIDEPSLLDAATLAAHHSPQKSAAKVEVTYTRVKNVHPVPSGPPGLVSVSASKTILIRMEKDRLERLERDRMK